MDYFSFQLWLQIQHFIITIIIIIIIHWLYNPGGGYGISTNFWRYFHLSIDRGERSSSQFRGWGVVSMLSPSAIIDFLDQDYRYKISIYPNSSWCCVDIDPQSLCTAVDYRAFYANKKLLQKKILSRESKITIIIHWSNA